MGARTVAYSRASRAWVVRAESACTVPASASAAARLDSQSDCEMRFCSKSLAERSASSRALVAWARSRASVPMAWASVARNGRVSSANSAVPAATSWPSRNAIRVITPPTCEPTSAVWIASTVPLAMSE